MDDELYSQKHLELCRQIYEDIHNKMDPLYIKIDAYMYLIKL